MPDLLPPLIAATKTLTSVPEWRAHEDQFRFVVTLEVEGVTLEGFLLRGQCIREIPDRCVMFQLDYLYPGFRRGPAMRIDWRPQNPHTNKNIGPADLRFLIIEGSHIHPFDHNCSLGIERIVAENLPIAAPLNPDPTDFGALVREVGKAFNIEGLEAVSVPPWEPRLFG